MPFGGIPLAFGGFALALTPLRLPGLAVQLGGLGRLTLTVTRIARGPLAGLSWLCGRILPLWRARLAGLVLRAGLTLLARLILAHLIVAALRLAGRRARLAGLRW